MAVNTNKVGYSVPEVCQIIHCSNMTLYRLIDSKEIECLVTEPKTPGGRRQFRFLKEHIQHYMLKHYDKFEDSTLRTWGVMTTPRKFTANASTPRIPIDAFSKPVEGTPTKPNPNMDRITPSEWAGTKKPYLRTEAVKAQEQKEKSAAATKTPFTREPGEQPRFQKGQKTFPKFKLEVDMCAGEVVVPNDIQIAGLESQTAADIAKALLYDRNIRVKEIRITFDGTITKED